MFAHSARASADGMQAFVSYRDLGVVTRDISGVTDPTFVSHTVYPPFSDGDAHSLVPYSVYLTFLDPPPAPESACRERAQDRLAARLGAAAVVHDVIADVTSPQQLDVTDVRIPVLHRSCHRAASSWPDGHARGDPSLLGPPAGGSQSSGASSSALTDSSASRTASPGCDRGPDGLGGGLRDRGRTAG